MLLANQTVTLYHKAGREPQTKADRWERTVLQNASWFARRVSSVSDRGLLSENLYTVRVQTARAIPAAPGDRLFLGAQGAASPREIGEEVAGCTVLGVTDNRRGAPHLWHWKLEGS